MTTAIASDNLAQFKTGVNELLQKRDYFCQMILPKLIENKDYYVIKGRKSLGKAGAEKLASIYNLVATFEKDTETMESFKGIDGLITFICTLSRNGAIVGQGRGSAILKNNGGDANKTIKMAEKSAYISGVIRSTGLSDIFSQDLETMRSSDVSPSYEIIPEAAAGESDTNLFPRKSAQGNDDRITEKQKNLLNDLISQRVKGKEEKERWFSEIAIASKFDASEMISSLLMSARR